MWGGVAGPLVFAVAVIAAGALRPGYSHLDQFMSELGETGGRGAWVMNAGFVVTGLLIAAFGVALADVAPRTRLGIAGAVLVAAFGLGTTAAGLFSCDPGCPDRHVSWHATLHHLVSLVGFLAAIAGAAVWAARFRQLGAWRAWWPHSAATSGVALVLLGAVIGRGHGPLAGLWQRVFIATLFLWCAAVALHAWRVTASKGLPGARSVR